MAPSRATSNEPDGADRLHAARGDRAPRPHRRGRARPLRRVQARRRGLRGHPADHARRHDRDRGQDLLGERRLRPARDRRRRPRLAARQQPRRVDDHPAARPRAPARSGPGAGRGPDVRAQAQGDHPVDPGDAVLRRAGRRRQAADHHGLPQPDLLRQPELRREGRGSLVLRQGARRPDAGRGGDPGRAPQVAVQLRPRAQRQRELRRASRKTTQPVPRPTATSSSRPTPSSSSAGTRSSSSWPTTGPRCRRTSTATPS